MANMISKGSISIGIMRAIPDSKEDSEDLTAKEELDFVQNFKSSCKTCGSTIIMKMCTASYDGQGTIREHIVSMCQMAANLKALDQEYILYE